MPAHLLIAGLGSGGMAVLDSLCRDERITSVTLIDFDRYEAHNAVRHFFPATDAGVLKVNLAAGWVRRFRPDVECRALPVSLLDSAHAANLDAAFAAADYLVCAVDGEPGKFAFDEFARRHNKGWTLGEVLSGGVAGWVHRFVPGGPCYGCVASELGRESAASADPLAPAPNYADPGAAIPAARVAAGKASVAAVAALHALCTMEPGPAASWLIALATVPALFEEPFRTRKLTIARRPDCLVCSAPAPVGAPGDLDAELARALNRLGGAP